MEALEEEVEVANHFLNLVLSLSIFGPTFASAVFRFTNDSLTASPNLTRILSSSAYVTI